MDRLELVQLALRDLGDVPAADLSAFIEQQHGVRIEPRYIPIFKASLRDKQRQEAMRSLAKRTVAPSVSSRAPEAA